MSLDLNMAPYRPTIMCDKCGYVQIYFKRGIRDENGVRIPYEVRTGLKHACDFSYPWVCKICSRLIYTDKKILSLTGRRILLNFELDTYHYCDTRSQKGRVKS